MTEELTVAALDERYARLRIVQPAAERAVRESLRRLGQLMPIVVCERDSSLAIVDGFKRVASARTLGFETLLGRVMPFVGETAALSALVSLNRAGRGLTDLEEGMVVRALCRDHGLEQIAVAELLGRHASWVCRRLSLAERLAEIVTDDVRAGLITTTVAREVARLPRGNQAEVAAVIRQQLLGSREAARLVTLFTQTSGVSQRHYLLEHPREALAAHDPREPLVTHDPRLGSQTQALRQRLWGALRTMSALGARLEECAPAQWTAAEREVIAPLIAKTRGSAELLLGGLEDILGATETRDAS